MKRTHRAGTITLGICLILFGGLFLAKMFIPSLSYELILRLWPIILVVLGIEVLVSHFIKKEEALKFDAGSIVLTFLLTGLSMCMAGTQILLEHVGTVCI